MGNIKDLVRRYRINRKMRKYSGDRNNNSLHASINSKEDIERYFNIANSTYEQLIKNYDLVEDDIISLKEAIADYEVCVNKVLQMMESAITVEGWDYSYEEIRSLIDNVEGLHEKADKIIQRRLFQD